MLVAQSCLILCDPPWTVSSRLLCPWGLSRQEYWSGLQCPLLRDLPIPGIEPRSLVLQVDSLLSEPPGSPWVTIWPINPTTEHKPWESCASTRHMYPQVHCSTIYNSQEMEATYRWMDKDVVYIYNSAIKRNECEAVLVRWMNLEPIIQSEVSQKEKNKRHILVHIYGI